MKIRILSIALFCILFGFNVDLNHGLILQSANAQTDENRPRFYHYNEELHVLNLLEFEQLKDFSLIPDMDSLNVPIVELEDGSVIINLSFGGSAEVIETFDGTRYRRETYLRANMVEGSEGKEDYLKILQTIGTSLPWIRYP